MKGLRKASIICLLTLLSLAVPFAAQKPAKDAWGSKPINEWNETDVKTILEALFYFDRYDAKGKLLLTPDNSTLTFNFQFQPGDGPILKSIDIVREGQVIF